jgi:putative endonuclease
VGEGLAARFLNDHGLSPIGSNVRVGKGEVDLLAMDGSTRVVVEVRTTTGTGDPIDAIDHQKRDRVGRLAAKGEADRVDLIGIRLDDRGMDVHWLPGGS